MNTPTVLSLCYPTTGAQDKVITFLSNRVKESKLKLLIFVDFSSCLQQGHCCYDVVQDLVQDASLF